MKLLGGLLVLVLFGVTLLPRDAAAKVPEYNHQLQVTGVVLPAQHIVVDDEGVILQILSNTKKDVTPKVYTGKISKEALTTMTPEIYEQYRQIVPEGRSRVGTLYERSPGSEGFVSFEELTRTNSRNPYDISSPVLNNAD